MSVVSEANKIKNPRAKIIGKQKNNPRRSRRLTQIINVYGYSSSSSSPGIKNAALTVGGHGESSPLTALQITSLN